MVENLKFDAMQFYKGKKIMFKNPVFIDHVQKTVLVNGHRSGWLIDYEKKEGENVVMLFFNAGVYFAEMKNIKLYTGWIN